MFLQSLYLHEYKGVVGQKLNFLRNCHEIWALQHAKAWCKRRVILPVNTSRVLSRNSQLPVVPLMQTLLTQMPSKWWICLWLRGEGRGGWRWRSNFYLFTRVHYPVYN